MNPHASRPMKQPRVLFKLELVVSADPNQLNALQALLPDEARRRTQTEREPDLDPLQSVVFELLEQATFEVLSKTDPNLTLDQASISRGVPEPAEPMESNLPAAPDEILAAEDEFDEDLDELDTPAFLCRWPNGEFSIVTGITKREAIINLDEWGAAHPEFVYPLDDDFMCDFRLNEAGEIELIQFGEATTDAIWERCYPHLQKVLDEATDDNGELLPEGEERIKAAVEHERKRLWENQPVDEAKTELGKEIGKQMGASGIVADDYVKQMGKTILKSKLGEKGKPN